MRSFKNLSILFIAAAVISCKKGNSVQADAKSQTTDASTTSTSLSATVTNPIIVYTTLADGSKKLLKEANINYNTTITTNPVITVTTDASHQYQTMDGIGLALTGSAAYTLKTSIPSATNRATLFTELFTTSGINLNVLRITIGCSDFSTTPYTYDDMPAGQTNGSLSNFNLLVQDDVNYVIPILKEILAINPNIYIIATPWSPPAWMKRSGTLNGTSSSLADSTQNGILTGYYSVYAKYLVKYLQGMEAQGIHINAITPQNEPRTLSSNYPTTYLGPSSEASFVTTYLKPEIDNAGLSTKILCGDNNWSGSSYHTSFMQNGNARAAVAGTAYHGYGGTPDVMTTMHNLYPTKEVHYTEFSGNVNDSFSSVLASMAANDICESAGNWAQTIVDWNLALDGSSLPNIKGSSSSRPVMVITSAGAITRNADYYVLGHAAKTMRVGAKRINTTDITSSSISNVGFINPDGWKTLVVTNTGTTAKAVDVKLGTQKFTYTIAAKAVNTFNWQ
ncbi:MAG: glycoside hydrolase family 30 beta sandwich domain-containing protein [Mucilaginibacter sp.]|uniref:glycoside hydrolase family 30 protein n=1 Tax=Mucilaginibacter sp. TaxID=1882438 RepID=UPI00326301C1